MADPSYGNEMTEVALALAMAFFSIMVLTMVSMSSSTSTITHTSPSQSKLTTVEASETGGRAQSDNTQLVIFWKNRFMDKNLKPVEFNKFNENTAIILAISPELKMAEVIGLRSRFKSHKTSFSPLDPTWIERLHLYDKKGR